MTERSEETGYVIHLSAQSPAAAALFPKLTDATVYEQIGEAMARNVIRKRARAKDGFRAKRSVAKP